MLHTSKLSSKKYWTLLGIVALLLLLLVVPGASFAAKGDTVEPFVVILPPNATVEVVVNGYCLNRGLPFPGDTMQAGDLAPDEVRVAIAHIVEQGYIQSDMYQSQLAIWHLTDGEIPTDVDHTLADEIIEYAKSGVEPFDVGASITSLPEAIKAGTVSAVLKNYVDIADDPSPDYEYFGQGNLVLTNLTDQEQTIHIPYGMTFKDTTQEGVQDMGIFPADTEDTACNAVKVDIPANASTELTVDGYCMDRTAEFPGSELTVVDLAPDKVRKTVCYSQDEGLLATNLYDTQLAVWNAIDGETGEADDQAVVDKVVEMANDSANPVDTGSDGPYLSQAVDEGLVSAEVSNFADIAPDPYNCFGQGTLTISNLTDTDQSVYIPYGTVVEDPNNTEAQNMAVFLSDGTVEIVPEVLPESGGTGTTQWLQLIVLLALGCLLIGGGYAIRQQV